ncbi:hypothetical protein Bbelb_292810 [Branchiostoma belcheri]|nr:hypothetical protein Bbelb_292810 [Branchiostoma belcheri]
MPTPESHNRFVNYEVFPDVAGRPTILVTIPAGDFTATRWEAPGKDRRGTTQSGVSGGLTPGTKIGQGPKTLTGVPAVGGTRQRSERDNSAGSKIGQGPKTVTGVPAGGTRQRSERDNSAGCQQRPDTRQRSDRARRPDRRACGSVAPGKDRRGTTQPDRGVSGGLTPGSKIGQDPKTLTGVPAVGGTRQKSERYNSAGSQRRPDTRGGLTPGKDRTGPEDPDRRADGSVAPGKDRKGTTQPDRGVSSGLTPGSKIGQGPKTLTGVPAAVRHLVMIGEGQLNLTGIIQGLKTLTDVPEVGGTRQRSAWPLRCLTGKERGRHPAAEDVITHCYPLKRISATAHVLLAMNSAPRDCTAYAVKPGTDWTQICSFEVVKIEQFTFRVWTAFWTSSGQFVLSANGATTTYGKERILAKPRFVNQTQPIEDGPPNIKMEGNDRQQANKENITRPTNLENTTSSANVVRTVEPQTSMFASAERLSNDEPLPHDRDPHGFAEKPIQSNRRKNLPCLTKRAIMINLKEYWADFAFEESIHNMKLCANSGSHQALASTRFLHKTCSQGK